MQLMNFNIMATSFVANKKFSAGANDAMHRVFRLCLCSYLSMEWCKLCQKISDIFRKKIYLEMYRTNNSSQKRTNNSQKKHEKKTVDKIRFAEKKKWICISFGWVDVEGKQNKGKSLIWKIACKTTEGKTKRESIE